MPERRSREWLRSSTRSARVPPEGSVATGLESESRRSRPVRAAQAPNSATWGSGSSVPRTGGTIRSTCRVVPSRPPARSVAPTRTRRLTRAPPGTARRTVAVVSRPGRSRPSATRRGPLQPAGSRSRRDGRPEPPRAAGVDGERDPAARDHVEAAGGEEELGAHRQAAGALPQRALEHRVAARVGRRVGDTRGELRELVAVELRRVRGRVLEHRPALGGVLALRLDLDLRPRPARQAAPARPHAEHLVGGLGGLEATRAVATRRPLALGAVLNRRPTRHGRSPSRVIWSRNARGSAAAS